jgi:hypothetical protein
MKPTQEQVIAWAREAGFSRDWQGTWHCIFAQMNEAFTLAYEAGAAAEREKVAQWMIQRGYATGHGDTIEDLLAELDWQIAEKIAIEREACAKVAESYEPRCDSCPSGVANAIRARGQG